MSGCQNYPEKTKIQLQHVIQSMDTMIRWPLTSSVEAIQDQEKLFKKSFNELYLYYHFALIKALLKNPISSRE